MWTITISLSALYLLLLACYFWFHGKSGGQLRAPGKRANQKRYVFLILLGGFLIRLVFAGAYFGHPTDMNCWIGWGQRLAENRPWNFYTSGQFADYPPGYMYILWGLGALAQAWNIPYEMQAVLYKLPAIAADVLIALTVYHFAGKEGDEREAIWLAVLMAFQPLLYFDSVIWGQIDSVLTVLLLLSLYYLCQKRYFAAVALFAAAVLVKPQALMVTPVYIFAFLQTRDIRLMVKGLVLGLIILLAVSIPFSPAWIAEGTVLEKISRSLDSVWLIERYLDTLGSYSYAVVNACNLYTLLGLNWAEADSAFWQIWGAVVILLTVALSAALYIRLRREKAAAFISAFFIFAFLYLFGTKMHERYLIPAIMILPVLALMTKERGYLYAFGGLTAANLCNLGYVLQCLEEGNRMPEYAVMAVISVIQIICVGYAFALIILQCRKNGGETNGKTKQKTDPGRQAAR